MIELLGTSYPYPDDPWVGVIGVCTFPNSPNFLDDGTRFDIIPGPGWFWMPNNENKREYRLITHADMTGIKK